MLQALRGTTLNASWAAGEEDRADLTVLAEDPLWVPDTEPAGLPVLLTVAAGRITRRAAEP
ncbi:hypothetical protein ACGFZB_32800 [Streptomyces cinerochromogenes]|uniref:Amidohydrolase 3 domain-containing protein n=1 Tax=Streptomyces cinerochromogenes TaxID=66422 RepID=A0ABW7BGE6_9ACTN